MNVDNFLNKVNATDTIFTLYALSARPKVEVFGGDHKDSITLIGLLANEGLGERGCIHAFETIFLTLNRPKVQNELTQIGVSVVDQSGKNKTIISVMKQLKAIIEQYKCSERVKVVSNIFGKQNIKTIFIFINTDIRNYNELRKSL